MLVVEKQGNQNDGDTGSPLDKIPFFTPERQERRETIYKRLRGGG
jgi:hypothetical protein